MPSTRRSRLSSFLSASSYLPSLLHIQTVSARSSLWKKNPGSHCKRILQLHPGRQRKVCIPLLYCATLGGRRPHDCSNRFFFQQICHMQTGPNFSPFVPVFLCLFRKVCTLAKWILRITNDFAYDFNRLVHKRFLSSSMQWGERRRLRLTSPTTRLLATSFITLHSFDHHTQQIFKIFNCLLHSTFANK